MARPFSLPEEVATCVAQLCCKDGALPQGAPTSPVLSNLICRSLDRGLVALARRHRMRVSRYADDICFSTNQTALPAGVVASVAGQLLPGDQLTALVRNAGFELNPSKFKVRATTDQQLVTGLVVNKGVGLPRHWRRQLRVLLHLVDRHGVEKAKEIGEQWVRMPVSRGGYESIEQVIRGKTNYAQYVDRRCGRGFSDSIYRNYSGVRRLMPRPVSGISFRVMSEGKTDLLHLEAALRSLQNQGEYLELRPRFINFLGEAGDVELIKTLNRIAKSDIPELTIGVLDCDNPVLMAKEGLTPGGVRQIGAGVYLMCLGEPSSLKGSPYCIESLYPREQLVQPTVEGRRVFLSDEFDTATGVSYDGLYRRAQPKSKALLVSDTVTRLEDGFSCLLGKSDFADSVFMARKPFDQMDFGAFEPTFALMRKILDAVHGH